MKRAVIVGASSGIGRETARLLIADGWHVGLMARRVGELNALKAVSPDTVEVQECDIRAENAPGLLLDLVDRMGGTDLYLHVAGTGKQNTGLDEAVETATVSTNVAGFTRMIDAMFNYMAAHQGGHIAAVTSIAGVKGLGPAPSYSASKAFQNIYIQALEQLSETRRLNIKFTDIRPGFVDTPLIEGSDFPMKMNPVRVARAIVKAIYAGRHVVVVDRRYALLVALWRLVPRCVWRKLRLSSR